MLVLKKQNFSFISVYAHVCNGNKPKHWWSPVYAIGIVPQLPLGSTHTLGSSMPPVQPPLSNKLTNSFQACYFVSLNQLEFITSLTHQHMAKGMICSNPEFLLFVCLLFCFNFDFWPKYANFSFGYPVFWACNPFVLKSECIYL